MQSKDPQCKAKYSQSKKKTPSAKTPSARLKTLSAWQRLPVQGKDPPVHGKDFQCKAKAKVCLKSCLFLYGLNCPGNSQGGLDLLHFIVNFDNGD